MYHAKQSFRTSGFIAPRPKASNLEDRVAQLEALYKSQGSNSNTLRNDQNPARTERSIRSLVEMESSQGDSGQNRYGMISSASSQQEALGPHLEIPQNVDPLGSLFNNAIVSYATTVLLRLGN
jgi:hypothetical protein